MAEARACIDEKIAMHMSSIRNLRSQRNSLSPLCRLPPELLATIFIRCAIDHYNNAGSLVAVPSWVNVSYVCCYCRGVALACPTLWTYHFVVSLPWTEELLARSKQAPLQIRLIYTYSDRRSWWLSLLKILMHRAEYIQEFHLDFSENCDYRILSKLSTRAPRLQNLKITVQGSSSPTRSSVIFRGDTPTLCTLELSGCSVPWSSFNSSSLTTLYLRDVPNKIQQTVEEFLVLLGCMQDLQHLYLSGALSETPVSPSWKIKINLPHLSRLLIVAPLSTVIVLLSCINSPLETELRLHCLHSSLDDCTLLSSVLAQRLSKSEDQTSSSLTIHSLAIDISRRLVDLIFYASECPCAYIPISGTMEWGSDIPLKIVLEPEPLVMSGNMGPFVSETCSSIPLANVGRLVIANPPFSPTFWMEMLGNLQGLHYIKLNRGRMPDLASVLSCTGLTAYDGMEIQCGHATDGRNINVLVPGLKELDLYRITFSREGGSNLPAITQQRLFNALSARDMSQGRLRVVMTQCGMDGAGRFDTVRTWNSVIESSKVGS